MSGTVVSTTRTSASTFARGLRMTHVAHHHARAARDGLAGRTGNTARRAAADGRRLARSAGLGLLGLRLFLINGKRGTGCEKSGQQNGRSEERRVGKECRAGWWA